MSEWQPIETAPLDGTSILVAVESEQDSHQVVYFDDDGEDDFVWRSENNRWHRNAFTHWMPLPTPPEAKP
jgi:hypothetical protein